MRRRPLAFMAPRTAVLAATLGLAAAALPGCRTMTETGVWMFRKGDLITYEQYLSIDANADPKPSVDDVINMLGKPNDMRDRDGARVRLDYLALTINDDLKRAEFRFDKNERLVTKELW
ncbi:MAG: hypothetical protein HMLKMBBP_02512 [Planctomycetes bacterium]|nr:hypothetical protein [Planctomycetota bacterium]